MIRALGIAASIIALAVSAAPAALAGPSKPAAVLYNGHAGLGIVTDNKDPDKRGAARDRGSGVISSVNVKYT